MTVFSITEIRNFRRCREMWNYTSPNRMNLTKIGVGAEALELGGIIHRALARWILEYNSNQPENYLANLFMEEANSRKKEAEEKYLNVVGVNMSEEELGPLLDVIMLGKSMMENYQAFHKTPIPNHMKFAAPEQEILIPVPGTDHHIRATLDGLLVDLKDRLWILEHKTYEQRPKWEYLIQDDQLTGYTWAAGQLNIGDVVGVAYDGMWKRPTPPKYMQTERRAGRLEDLFLRKTLLKDKTELEVWGINVAKTLNDMGGEPYIIPNVPWQGCFDCGFRQPCLDKMRGHTKDEEIYLKRMYMQNDIVRVQGVVQREGTSV